MAIIETGIMFSGIPLVKVFYQDDGVADSMLTAGLIEAIQLFALEIFNDETETFKMKRYSIYLLNTNLSKGQTITLYAICDSIDRPTAVKDIMKNLSSKFKKKYPSIDLDNLSTFVEFKQVITKEVGDLRYRPEDRLRQVFL